MVIMDLKLMPFCTGPLVSDKVEASPVSLSRYGPPSDPPPIPCPGWPPRPRVSSYSVFASRPSIDSQVSQAAGGATAKKI